MNLMSCPVIGMPGLGLELQKHADPLAGPGKIKQEGPILVYPVIAGKTPHIALIHMDIVDTIAGAEAEYLVGRVAFGPPTLAEGIDKRLLVGHRTLYELIDFLVQIVIRTGCAEGEHAHIARIKQVATNKVECCATRPG